jgi:2-polyprenyl-3-methyl-5-hydroxy-6-metoxy-1,4-benzoquinol methylase
MELLSICPICNSEKISFYLKILDHSISKKVFSLTKCSNCNFIFTNPRPNKTEIYKYYESPDYISHSNSKIGLINKMYQFVRQFSIRHKISIITKYSSRNKKLLDIGCGTGEFLKECNSRGWEVKGIEPSLNARDFAVKRYSLPVFSESEIDSFNNSSFQVITLWHVLEHVHELNNRIKDIFRLLVNNGITIIALPNLNSYDANYYEENWAAYDVPRHLYHFSSQNVKDLFEKNGFEWLHSIPMKFDAFYVSILSEKYKHGKRPIISGLWNGLKSNFAAHGDPEKYSSVIYIFKKKF